MGEGYVHISVGAYRETRGIHQLPLDLEMYRQLCVTQSESWESSSGLQQEKYLLLQSELPL